MDVFFYVQHLLGTGHFYRSAAIANALSQEGLQVALVSGGMPLSSTRLKNVELWQLPGLRARDGNFSDLVDDNNKPVSSMWWKERHDALMEYWNNSKPGVLITESYPFARRMLRHELKPLLKAAQMEPRTKMTVCSVRDIPQPKSKPGRSEEAVALVEQYYSHVLVHGDPGMATLTETFPEAERITHRTTYTGYVDSIGGDSKTSEERSDVLVSAGGGAAGLMLYEAAVKAAQTDVTLQWRLLVGGNLEASKFDGLVQSSGDNVIVERNRTDFRELLKATKVSVSQAGYNTVVDVVRSGVCSVLVPYAQGGEKEQTIRARKLAQNGRVVHLAESDLTASSLMAAVAQAKGLVTQTLDLSINGAEVSAKMIGNLLQNSSPRKV